MKVIESNLIQEVPKIQLSYGFTACSPEFKGQMNAWLRERFGTYWPVYIISSDTIFAHPKHIAMLKLEASNVELTGAARLYRAASSDRRERG